MIATRRTATSLIVMIAIGTLALAGCSGSDASEGTTGEAKTVKIMAFGSLSSPPFPLPELAVGAQAAVDRVNSDELIPGVKLELVTCDDQGNANGATACGQKAVSEGVAAVVGQFTLFGDAFVGITESAGIPLIFPAAVSKLEVTSETSFPLISAVAPALAILQSFDELGCETTVITASENAQSQNTYESFTKPFADAQGYDTVFLPYPPDTTDFTNQAALIAEAGDCVQYNGGAPDTSAIMRALKQSGAAMKEQAVLSDIAMPEASLAEIGDDTNGLGMYAPLKFPSTGQEESVQAGEDITATDSSSPVDMISLNSYAAVMAFAQIAADLDEVSATAVEDKLSDPSTTLTTGIYPEINFSEQMGFYPITPRVSGSLFYSYVADDGKWAPNGDVTTDLSHISE